MSTTITHTHRDVVITYNEDSNTWDCEHFSRPAESLAKAKERIDAKLDKEEKEPFKEFTALTQRFACFGGWSTITVTSILDGGNEAWATCEGERKKIGIKWYPLSKILFLDNDHNRVLLQQMAEKKKEVEKLHVEIEALEMGMQPWEGQP